METTQVKHDSNTDIFRGQLFIFVEDNPIAYGKDATMNITTAEIDASNKMMDGDWEVPLPGKKSFTISSESLLTQKEGQESFDSLLNKQIQGKTFPFCMGSAKVSDKSPTGGGFALDKAKKYYTGTVMITSLDVKSTDGDIATCSASFKGVGALTPGTPTT